MKCLLVVLLLLTAALSAPAADPMVYHLKEGSETWPADKREQIVKAMDSAIALYNKLGKFPKTVIAAYNPGTPTADGNYNGNIRFGGQIGHRVALHELGHVLGIGQHPKWSSFVKDGLWTGPNAIKQLREFDGPKAVLHADRMHFWPYGLNFDTEDSKENERRHVLMVAAFRRDLGIDSSPAPSTPALGTPTAKPRRTPAPMPDGYVMGYFTESPRHLGDSRNLHLAVSLDGLNWMPLNQNQPVLVPDLGEKGLRDPYFVRKADGTFVILATNLRDNMAPFHNILIWDSDDLITFKNARLVDLHDTPMHTFAPEAFWDPSRKKYGVIWSGNTDYNRIYVNYTDDFVTFGPHELFFDPGADCLDATILREPVNGEYFLYDKDFVTRRLRGARSKSLEPRSFDSGTYTRPLGEAIIEAPLVYKATGRNRWYLWGDSYSPVNGEFYAWKSDDITKDVWEPLSKRDYNQPLNAKHATVLPISGAEMEKLITRWGTPKWNRIKSYSQPDFLVRHANYQGVLSAYPFDPYTDSLWKLVPGLSNAYGLSFESVSLPGYFLRRVRTGVVLAKNDESPGFKTEATFLKAPGLADATWSSFRAIDAPTSYLRNVNGTLQVGPLSSAGDKEAATFKLVY